MKDIITLGIETSCDETSAAVVVNGRKILSNIINSQIDIHTKYGGVVPEIASRCHIEVINQVVKEALREAKLTYNDIDAICVTHGPGLVGALLVGLSYAKGLSYATNKPLVGVNHIEGHIAANYLTYEELKPPFLCLIISGGHTHLVKVNDYTEFEIIGMTKDDAIGEAYDKVARVVDLGYPGGPKIDKLAYEGKANINLPKSNLEGLNFSFSGIKTAVINLNHKNPNVNKADLCASFEKVTTEMLLENVIKAIDKTNLKNVVLAGGVAANSYIRKEFSKMAKEKNITVYYPDIKLCTDNAAMIAAAGYYNYKQGKIAHLNLNAVPNLKIGGN